MSYNLFLDDIRYPKEVKHVELPLVDWVIVRNFNEFKTTVLSRGIPKRLSLDHDLGPMHYTHDWSGNLTYDQPTGVDCVRWLIEYLDSKKCTQFPEYWVHSMNPIGKRNIISLAESWVKARK